MSSSTILGGSKHNMTNQTEHQYVLDVHCLIVCFNIMATIVIMHKASWVTHKLCTLLELEDWHNDCHYQQFSQQSQYCNKISHGAGLFSGSITLKKVFKLQRLCVGPDRSHILGLRVNVWWEHLPCHLQNGADISGYIIIVTVTIW